MLLWVLCCNSPLSYSTVYSTARHYVQYTVHSPILARTSHHALHAKSVPCMSRVCLASDTHARVAPTPACLLPHWSRRIPRFFPASSSSSSHVSRRETDDDAVADIQPYRLPPTFADWPVLAAPVLHTFYGGSPGPLLSLRRGQNGMQGGASEAESMLRIGSQLVDVDAHFRCTVQCSTRVVSATTEYCTVHRDGRQLLDPPRSVY